MKDFTRGQKARLADLTTASSLDVGIAASSQGALVLDVSCFGLDGEGRLSDDRYFIFYNQRTSPCGCLQAGGPQNGYKERFRLDLSKLPPKVRRIVFTVTVDGTGTMSELAPSYLQLLVDGRPIARVGFSGRDFAAEKAVMIAELYWKDGWRFSAVCQGFNGGLAALLAHFGGEERTPAQASPPPPSLPPAPVVPPPVRLTKVTLDKQGSKQSVDLKKGGHPQPIHINLNWENPAGRRGFLGWGTSETPDLDLGCMLCMKDGDRDVIQPLGGNFGSRNSSPYIYLDKDDRSGAAKDGENLYILRPDLIARVMVFAFIYEGTANFAQIHGRLTIKDQQGNEILVPLNNPDGARKFCAICLIENRGDRIDIVKEERYFSGHREADRHYGFGFSWTAGRK